MQKVFDDLYARSKAGQTISNLYDLITSRNNILLAYRNIKANTGSYTAGVNGHTIEKWKLAEAEQYVEYVQRRLANYHPHKVRRKMIPKPNGKLRPLGIPTIEDRLIQQCILQILEPWCEARFADTSYGFRPLRSTENAIADVNRKINRDKSYYIVDVDIKGFFDAVDHGKLLKQIWAMGIRDKRIISIISKMLKAQIVEEDGSITTPTRGTPQGGILSPLLANINLNELDWWIASQWHDFPIRVNLGLKPKMSSQGNGTRDFGNEFTKMRRTTSLKEMSIVRYADDFKIFCKTAEDANKTYWAVKKWLMDRLHLEISPEKSGVVDVRKQSTEFLGITIKAILRQTDDKPTARTHMSDKAKAKTVESLRKQIQHMAKHKTPQAASVYNAKVLGAQNYYSMATMVTRDLADVNYRLYLCRKNQLGDALETVPYKQCAARTVSRVYLERYSGYRIPRQYFQGICLFPIQCVKSRNPLGFPKKQNLYTPEGREEIHKNLKLDEVIMLYLLEHTPMDASTELADNRISLYSAQRGRCWVTGAILTVENMRLHHKKPKHTFGQEVSKGSRKALADAYDNLVWVTEEVHILIHATQPETIAKYLTQLDLNTKQLAKLNKLRELAGNTVIE